ncbi:MAG: hypothetical protein ACKPHU_06170, partial [Planctomycetaceae bacterium]
MSGAGDQSGGQVRSRAAGAVVMCSLLWVTGWYLLVSTGLGGLSAAALYGLVDEPASVELQPGERLCL